jgi:hypothetical protein
MAWDYRLLFIVFIIKHIQIKNVFAEHHLVAMLVKLEFVQLVKGLFVA